MSIEMTKQSSIELIISSVKDFKRTGERITELIRQQHNQEALLLLTQEEKNAAKIEESLRHCEEGYLNPEIAKKIMIIRNQFKDERGKLARLFHAARV
jgi:PHD/YefM family antitoxin component YafN of YafNO toxin-antitoxin module